MKNIVLIGFMGSGKTTVGRELALFMGYDFYDSDHVLEDTVKASIPEIFKEQGEQYFRSKEEEVIARLSEKNNCVIATGGGAVLNPVNTEHLQHNGLIIYLNADWKHVYDNVKDQSHRPLLQTENPKSTLMTLLDSRQKTYEDASDVMIDVTGKSIMDIVKEIRCRLSDMDLQC